MHIIGRTLSSIAHVTITRVDRSGTETERLEGVAFINKDGGMRVSVSEPEGALRMSTWTTSTVVQDFVRIPLSPD